MKRYRGPYIGIIGITNSAQVGACLPVIRGSHRKFMVGLLASRKTFQGGEHKFPRRYPPREELGRIFIRDPHLLNLVHYSTKETEGLENQLGEVMDVAGPFCDGVQLNIAWPNPSAVFRFRWRHPDVTIVLQCGRRALDEVNRDPVLLVRRISRMYGIPGREPHADSWLIDHVLLDPSGGEGQPFDPNEMFRYLDAFAEHGCIQSYPLEEDWALGVGTAGGLWTNTLYRLSPLTSQYRQLSCDAEGKLRDGEDELDLQRGVNYILETMRVMDPPDQRLKTSTS